MGWVIVGLGNPGEEYTATRHNAGRMAVEYFAKSLKSGEFREDTKAKAHVAGVMVGPATAGRGKSAAALVLPDTFMNKSGSALLKFVKSVKAAERLVVVYDDLDLPLGKVKLSYDRGSGGHKGLESVMRALKTKKFTRVRIGVSPSTAGGALRKPEGDKVILNFILTKFRAHELEELKRVFKRVAHALESIVTEGREQAMNHFNS
ncbi:MAG: aminoacyl-tRNA hydrolase [Patescibacteria group bacterium]